jgi:hypothetical protein
MFCAAIQGLRTACLLTRVCLHASVSAGEPVDQTEVLSLASMAQSLFVTATIESRRLDRVEDCRRLWRETAHLFEELCSTWADVTSNDPNIHWLRGRLVHYRSLCVDRCELYRVTENERRVYAKRKALDSDSEYSFGTRGEIAAHCEKGARFLPQKSST